MTRTQERQALDDAKILVAEALNNAGVDASRYFCVQKLVPLVEKHLHVTRREQETSTSYFNRAADVAARTDKQAPLQPATRRYLPAFRPLVVKPHLREAELNLLPRPISMGGIGNGSENSQVWTR